MRNPRITIWVNHTPVSLDMDAASIIWAVYVKKNPNSAIIFKQAIWLSPLFALRLLLYTELTDGHSAIFISEEGRLHSIPKGGHPSGQQTGDHALLCGG